METMKATKDGSVLALVADLLFASKVKGTAAAVGVEARIVRRREDLLGEARREPPRLILLDLEAPGLDAAELIEELKADAALGKVPVVAFGSHVRGEALMAARAAGADRVLARSAFVRELPGLLAGE